MNRKRHHTYYKNDNSSDLYAQFEIVWMENEQKKLGQCLRIAHKLDLGVVSDMYECKVKREKNEGWHRLQEFRRAI